MIRMPTMESDPCVIKIECIHENPPRFYELKAQSPKEALLWAKTLSNAKMYGLKGKLDCKCWLMSQGRGKVFGVPLQEVQVNPGSKNHDICDIFRSNSPGN